MYGVICASPSTKGRARRLLLWSIFDIRRPWSAQDRQPEDKTRRGEKRAPPASDCWLDKRQLLVPSGLEPLTSTEYSTCISLAAGHRGINDKSTKDELEIRHPSIDKADRFRRLHALAPPLRSPWGGFRSTSNLQQSRSSSMQPHPRTRLSHLMSSRNTRVKTESRCLPSIRARTRCSS